MAEHGNATHVAIMELLNKTLNNKDRVERQNQRTVYEWFESMQQKLNQLPWTINDVSILQMNGEGVVIQEYKHCLKPGTEIRR